MQRNQQAKSNSDNSQVFSFGADIKMSKFQPTDIKPIMGRDWLTNGLNNANYKRYRDAYDDSPTHSSIINAFVNYVYGEGLIDFKKSHISQAEVETNLSSINKFINQEDVLLCVQDYKIYGGFSIQVIWNEGVPIKIEYLPIYKLGVNFEPSTNNVNGYWFSWDWNNNYKYRPQFYPKFTGEYANNNLEVLVIRRPTAEPFFPLPDYLSGLPWAEVEGELANTGKSHFKNVFGALTVINYNSGRQATPEAARIEAAKVRADTCGSDNNARAIVSFNESIESAVTVDQLSPPELNQQNVFFAEEAERKLIVAHSAPPILFAGTNSGSGFSSNADEIALATKALYRRHINPMRKVILGGLQQVVKLMDSNVKLDFIDFKEENNLENNE